MLTREQYKRMFEDLKGRGWRSANSRLRCAKGYCPIVAAADQLGGLGFEEVVRPNRRDDDPNGFPHLLGRRLGLRTELIDGIVQVADGNTSIEQYVSYAFRNRPELKRIYLEALHDALDPLVEEVKS